jgi:hypothetical protein
MSAKCEMLDGRICRHPVIGNQIVDERDCAACTIFKSGSTEPRALEQDRPACMHRGSKLSVAPCCGQMFACNLHKGKKCAPTGIAKEPFLSCETCGDYNAPEYEHYPNSESIVTAEPPADK